MNYFYRYLYSCIQLLLLLLIDRLKNLRYSMYTFIYILKDKELDYLIFVPLPLHSGHALAHGIINISFPSPEKEFIWKLIPSLWRHEFQFESIGKIIKYVGTMNHLVSIENSEQGLSTELEQFWYYRDL